MRTLSCSQTARRTGRIRTGSLLCEGAQNKKAIFARREKAPRRPRPRKKRSLKAKVVLALLLLVLLGIGSLGVYLGVSTRNDDLWLDLDQIPYKTETIIYAKEENGDWRSMRPSPVPRTSSTLRAA